MDTPGHLFIAHGRLEWITHDAAIVPIGQEFHLSESWMTLVKKALTTQPAHWEDHGWGKAPDRDGLWIVSVGGEKPDRIEAILDRVEHSLRAIQEEQVTPVGQRARAMVAVPVIGIHGGGLSGRRGEVIELLVERLVRCTSELGIDVVIASPDPAVYSALQYARRKLFPPLPEPFEGQARRLAELARNEHLALFLGAGVSVPAGLPSWDRLIADLAAETPGLDPEDLKYLSAIDQAELIEKEHKHGFASSVSKLANAVERPSLLHALLAGLDSHQVVTTNYDRLYERAVRATGRKVESVMPWVSALGAKRWILKLHGDVQHPKMIVLTRRHMVRFDASNRPSAALLQSLFLTRHLLVVGASLTDDNVIRLAHEVQAYRDEHQAGGNGSFGTVLDIGGGKVRARLWDEQLAWVHLDDLDGTGGDGAGALEIFLDRIGFHAARNSAWLLDDRFEQLLKDPGDVEIARDVRALYAKLPHAKQTKWRPLLERLEELGARRSR